MSINSCTIDSFAIDALCGGRRQVIIDGLTREKYPVNTPGASNGGWRSDRAPAFQQPQINRPRWDPPEAPREQPTELERIIVTAQIFGVEGTDTQAVIARQDLVTVTDIHIEPATELGQIVVTAKIFGVEGTDKQAITANVQTVTITALQIEPTAVIVNIENFRVELKC